MNDKVDGRTGEPLPAVPAPPCPACGNIHTGLDGQISFAALRPFIDVNDADDHALACVLARVRKVMRPYWGCHDEGWTGLAVPDVDIAEMIDQANAITDEDAYWVFARENFSRALVYLEAARGRDVILTDGLKAAVRWLKYDDKEHVFEGRRVPDWLPVLDYNRNVEEMREALSLIQEKV